MDAIEADKILEEVRQRYGRIADDFKLEVSSASCEVEEDSACCDSNDLYDADVSSLPQEVTGLSLGCGDPVTLAELQPGQTVLDLGSGGGIDCFLAARQVGETGRVIGVDMTPAMLEKASRNKEKVGLRNVEFRMGQIEALPVESSSIDVIISNCVINLSPDKTAVFKEAFRVLKPGGRLAVTDIVTMGRFTSEQRSDMAAWSCCVTGAEEVTDLVEGLRQTGFVAVSVQDIADSNRELAGSPRESGPARWFSARITAIKPAE